MGGFSPILRFPVSFSGGWKNMMGPPKATFLEVFMVNTLLLGLMVHREPLSKTEDDALNRSTSKLHASRDKDKEQLLGGVFTSGGVKIPDAQIACLKLLKLLRLMSWWLEIIKQSRQNPHQGEWTGGEMFPSWGIFDQKSRKFHPKYSAREFLNMHFVPRALLKVNSNLS